MLHGIWRVTCVIFVVGLKSQLIRFRARSIVKALLYLDLVYLYLVAISAWLLHDSDR